MGKHNGKARSTGLPVGSALVNKAKKGLLAGPASSGRHTTKETSTMQSILETNDLSEMLSLADLAGRSFQAERHGAVLVSSDGAVQPAKPLTALERLAVDQAMQHRLKLPRRPVWTRDMSAAEVEEREKAAFLAWRRELALVEERDGILLTPFEKNLEVWRQLWRVLERCHILVQVVDARDPLFYRSEDLEVYAKELQATKESVLLLNKADLLPVEARRAWSSYFDSLGLAHYFWSAKAASEEREASASEGPGSCRQEAEGGRGRVLEVAELVRELELRATAAAEASRSSTLPTSAVSDSGTEEAGAGRVVVGLVGYPNVGKSSTINALFGSKKTAVAATPGKTKHFQTLNITDRLTLCDCPGLVLPRSASSKGDLVAAGVVPIDRLTDVREPVAVIAQRIPRTRLEAAYTMRLPPPASHEDQARPPTAAELLRAVAASRSWSVGGGLPDEARAGRLLLKDYTSGRLLHLEWPPGYQPPSALQALPNSGDSAPTGSKSQQAGFLAGQVTPGASERGGQRAGSEATSSGSQPSQSQNSLLLAEDSMLAGSLRSRREDKPRRPDYKFHKKVPRAKVHNRSNGLDDFAVDGTALPVGRKGGIMRVSA